MMTLVGSSRSPEQAGLLGVEAPWGRPGSAIRTVAVLGAGRLGSAIARLTVRADYDVLVAASRPPSELAPIVETAMPGARAVRAEEAARAGDIVVLAVPLSKYRALRPETLAGKIVVDVMNYWPPTDGVLAEFEGRTPSSDVIQRFLADARVIRTLNHIGYHELEQDALPSGHPRRRALAITGNDAQARATVGAFLDRLGFDPVDAGALAAARTFEPGTRIFAGRWQRAALERALALDLGTGGEGASLAPLSGYGADARSPDPQVT